MKGNVIVLWVRIAEQLRKWLRPQPKPEPVPQLAPPEAESVCEAAPAPVVEVVQPEPEAVVKAKRERAPRRLRVSLDQRIQELLEFMSESTIDRTTPKHRVELSEFDALEPLDETFDARRDRARAEIFPLDISPRTLGTWDVCWLIFGGGEGPDEMVKVPTRYQAGRFRSVNLRMLRGMRIKSPYAGQFAHALFLENKKIISCRVNMVWSPLGGWERASLHGQNMPLDARDAAFLADEVKPKDVNGHIQVALGIGAARIAYWHVVLGYDNLPSISFLTDPEGARSVFRLRDIPEGRERRAALRHWVNEHWRHTTRNEDEVKVRAYLRGALEFHWNGLHGRIVPSELDRNKNLERIFRPQPQEIEMEEKKP